MEAMARSNRDEAVTFANVTVRSTASDGCCVSNTAVTRGLARGRGSNDSNSGYLPVTCELSHGNL